MRRRVGCTCCRSLFFSSRFGSYTFLSMSLLLPGRFNHLSYRAYSCAGQGEHYLFFHRVACAWQKKAASRSTLNPRSASARIGMKWKKEKRERGREKDRDMLHTDFLAFLSIHSIGWMIPWIFIPF